MLANSTTLTQHFGYRCFICWCNYCSQHWYVFVWQISRHLQLEWRILLTKKIISCHFFTHSFNLCLHRNLLLPKCWFVCVGTQNDWKDGTKLDQSSTWSGNVCDLVCSLMCKISIVYFFLNWCHFCAIGIPIKCSLYVIEGIHLVELKTTSYF